MEDKGFQRMFMFFSNTVSMSQGKHHLELALVQCCQGWTQQCWRLHILNRLWHPAQAHCLLHSTNASLQVSVKMPDCCSITCLLSVAFMLTEACRM